ncbi:GNAT family N-acetyltransferase [Rhodoplanes azumiensis]|uniref:GNAT family N-acetyltransferase n=1 Tax=Rhodoplanes azumiensis TaxID=1897628 RepID=A0ABW5AM89_9BRAD
MPAGLRINVVSSIAEIPAPVWDACANPAPTDAAPGAEPPLAASYDPTSGLTYNPFVSHAFLSALEASRSAVTRTGWQPRHLVLEDATETVLGVVPCYLKSHSRGEYVFDHGWADAYERAGGRYYPKLQVAVPFTPATGRRLLVAPGPQAEVAQVVLLDGLKTLCGREGHSSVHVTFMTEAEASLAADYGWLTRTDQQFHWDNLGYGSFEDFLNALAARKRKAIRRERREAVENGIEIVRLTGAAIDEEAWDAFFAFYMDTGSRKWGRPYLTRDFFSRVGASMADQILLVMAKRNGRYIAGALNFIGGDTLFGRHWGAVEHHPFLHFELCYYQAIEFAIERRIPRVEAGAQGEHKLARGYLPNTTWSAHHIADPALRRAIADYLKRERAYVDAAARELAAASPFRRDGIDIRPPAEAEMEAD